MTELQWYKKQMLNPDLDTQTHLKYWNIARELEFNANKVYQEGLAKCKNNFT